MLCFNLLAYGLSCWSATQYKFEKKIYSQIIDPHLLYHKHWMNIWNTTTIIDQEFSPPHPFMTWIDPSKNDFDARWSPPPLGPHQSPHLLKLKYGPKWSAYTFILCLYDTTFNIPVDLYASVDPCLGTPGLTYMHMHVNTSMQ